ncbi:hypothetical protein [Methyloterricola oryzae]|uniref:hypothetical protein n=1 Tax=Methyloterricola oryzae TaxID=1495050 RepID=UPI0005EB4299|nr:hypothetical protein [Methyloterricola oryzae]
MDLPLILAGPILRRTEPNLVSVWLALRESADITLSIWDGLQSHSESMPTALASSAPQRSTRLGKALHLAVVTLVTPAPGLQPGRNYAYDLAIKTQGNPQPQTLNSLGLLEDKPFNWDDPASFASAHLALGYGQGQLPSFALPPKDLDQLRLVYGSCRLPCNDHLDAMTWIDDLISRSRPETPGADADSHALNRPHQLVLGGDQIYADDVAPEQIWIINRLAHLLISGAGEHGIPGLSAGPVENLSLPANRVKTLIPDEGPTQQRLADSLELGYAASDETATGEVRLPADLAHFPPGGRLDLLQIEARMTSSDGHSHLLSFGEFAAMHILVWSNACWLPEFWPAKADLLSGRVQSANRPETVAITARTLADTQAWGDNSFTFPSAIRPAVPDKTSSPPDIEWQDYLLQKLAEATGLAALTRRGEVMASDLKDVKAKSDAEFDWQDHISKVLHDAVQKEFPAWADDLPAPPGFTLRNRKGGADSLAPLAKRLEESTETGLWMSLVNLDRHHRLLRRFVMGLPKVRRALANVPTYMIFDDHDVTDDWFLNPVWCKQVLEAPLGRQIVRNGMASYAVFQDWGNNPLRYQDDDPQAAPPQLLKQIAALFADSTGEWPVAAAATEIDKLLGLNERQQLTLNATNPPMRWHFRVDGPAHVLAALDNRTRRSYVTRQGPPGNVAKEAQAEQIPAAPLDNGRLLILVAPLQVLAPSVFDEIVAPASYRLFDAFGAAPDKPKGRGGEFMVGTNPDAIEGWALDVATFEALLKRLAAHKRVLLLSGDVHYSAATQMSYWLKDQAEPARLVQFTSSGIKNVMPQYLTVVDRSLAFAQELIRSDVGADRMGWNDGAANAIEFAEGRKEADLPSVLRKRMRRKPAMLPTHGWPEQKEPSDPQRRYSRVRSDHRPDWSWCLSPVFDLRPDAERPEAMRPKGIDTTPDIAKQIKAGADPAQAYRRIAARHQAQLDKLGNARQLLFRSNIALVRFERVDGKLWAVQELYSVVPDPSANPVTNPPFKEEGVLDFGKLPKPQCLVLQRASLDPLADEQRPEAKPLKSGLAEPA